MIPRHVSTGNLIYRSDVVPVFERSQGLRIYDTRGRPYLDAEAANGTLAFGYDSELMADAARRIAGMPALPSFCESTQRLDVLERLERLFSEVTGVAGRVDLDLGGAQAMETALRIVAANKGPGTILVFQGAFHGRSGVTSMLSSSPRYRELLAAWGLEVVRLPIPGSGSYREGSADIFGEITGVGGRASGRRAVAMIFEPVLNVAGMIEPSHRELRAYVDAARREGALVIADEIFTGMHRTGPRWGFMRSGVAPDIVVTSKGLTNGSAAASVVWSRDDLAGPEAYKPGSHSSTYVGIPSTLGVIDAVLDRWEAWRDPESVVATIELGLTDVLKELLRRNGDVVAGFEVFGAAAGVRLNGDWAGQVRASALTIDPDEGLVLASTGIAPDVLNIHPPLIIEQEDVARIGSILEMAIADVRGSVV
ncbi:aminotransferase class III-fold pyridoxal phosphate-dependent enzyme [Cellulomonas cellasea]|uniref:aminotransferase class III-fold pyridoxal phosphate-dependent enzyme n=1 Tax=Cellulomonas cellasea TaxID=43670 RepID=UPI0025A327BD|nr:aminotransferase class III-fold pyridoxal phosphate-dependent enzyme [Cellulomonas cellasea]MDM8085103.1 aminotransferase class III-fold pyridoxal phosphate-dependent enzyme [Cellulomonas cellasea]